jgi:hypothetical protein
MSSGTLGPTGSRRVGPPSLTACTHAHPTGGRLGSTGAGSVTVSSVIVAAAAIQGLAPLQSQLNLSTHVTLQIFEGHNTAQYELERERVLGHTAIASSVAQAPADPAQVAALAMRAWSLGIAAATVGT